VTSEVFLRVASSLREFPGRTETDFRRWLFRIATNSVLAHLRLSRRRRELWDAAARSRQGKPFGESSDSPAIFEKSDWPTIYQALLELEERDQTIISLRFFADCSHEEIADVVDATAGAVRTALSRILSRLRERFSLDERSLPASGIAPKG
jgi:RNA polymerase sigma-70 factor (ECF subfamily)